MIENKKQYEAAKEFATQFKNRIEALEANKQQFESKQDYEYEYNSVLGQYQQLQKEISLYERLVNKEITTIKSMSIDQLDQLITQTRIAGNWTAEKVINKLGYWSVEELNKAERTDYEEVSLATLFDIIDVLGIEVELKDVVLPTHQYDNISQKELKAANKKQKILEHKGLFIPQN